MTARAEQSFDRSLPRRELSAFRDQFARRRRRPRSGKAREMMEGNASDADHEDRGDAVAGHTSANRKHCYLQVKLRACAGSLRAAKR